MDLDLLPWIQIAEPQHVPSYGVHQLKSSLFREQVYDY
jgi:hypothetical protein